MTPFKFRGRIAASKSILNRALVLQSFQPGLAIVGDSVCDDVLLMKAALQKFKDGERTFDSGHAGTVFRFLALRVAREPGEWKIKASSRLLERPQKGLYHILEQLGVSYEVVPDGLVVRGAGWRPRSEVIVEAAESSQFLSSLVLSGWGLMAPLAITLKGSLVSRGYFDLTEKLVRYFGMRLHSTTGGGWLIPAGQVLQPRVYFAEPDMSSCFALAACAVVGGSCSIENMPNESWQPDVVFKDLPQMMKAAWSQEGSTLHVSQTQSLEPLSADVNNNPDVVPVLAVLLALANGTSRLRGFAHLVHKESNRLEHVQKLLTRLGRRWDVINGEFLIYGSPAPFTAGGEFDPDQDHRMAMAAQVANFAGADFQIRHKEVVTKSFPEFWRIVGAE